MKVKEILQSCSPIWKPGRDYESGKPTVSVLLPTFRRAKSGLFEAAVQSVLNQDLKNIELIIIDDASTDGTATMIEHFMKLDPRVSWIRHTHNVGLPAISEYEGYLKARGEYIAFIFDDNEWERDYLDKTIAYMVRNDCKASYGRVRSYYSADEYLELGNTVDDTRGIHTLSKTNHIANGGVVLAREVIETVGLYDPHLAMTRLCDWNLWKRIVEKYEFSETGVMASKEKGASLSDSLGNSYRMDSWIAAEREHVQDREMLVPGRFAEIEIDQFEACNSRAYIDWVENAYQSFGEKKWHRERPSQPVENQKGPLRVLVIVPHCDASLTLSFERLVRHQKEMVIRIGDLSTPLSDIAASDAVILFRKLFKIGNIEQVCKKLKIPCFMYMDDNFVELAKENKKELSLQEMSRYLEEGNTKELDGIFVSTKELAQYCTEHYFNRHVSVIEPCIDERRIAPHTPVAPGETVTVAFMGGQFRQALFQDNVMSAIEKLSQKRKVRVLYPSRIKLDEFQNHERIELVPVEYSPSLDTALFRYGQHHPHILMHCGPDIKNNVYKTENALINAVQLGAVLLSSDMPPYACGAKQSHYCVCAENTAEAWYEALYDLTEHQDKARQIYEAARDYCLKRYTKGHALDALKQGLGDIRPAKYPEMLQRMRDVIYDLAYGGSMSGGAGTASSHQSRSLTEVPLAFTGGLVKKKRYDITCQIPELSELGICFACYGVPSGIVKVSILEDETPLRELAMDMESFVHDDWTYFKFEPIKDAAGKTFTVQLDFEYEQDSALLGVFEDASKITFLDRVQRKLGHTPKKTDILFVDCR